MPSWVRESLATATASAISRPRSRPCWKPISAGVPCRRTVIQPLRAPRVAPFERTSSARRGGPEREQGRRGEGRGPETCDTVIASGPPGAIFSRQW